MDKIDKLILLTIIVIFGIAILVTNLTLYGANERYRKLEGEAVRRGFAEYGPKFRWKGGDAE